MELDLDQIRGSDEIECLDIVDLGDASSETKQVSPIPIFFDSQLGIGLPF
jgi:hypothetical protein